MATTCPSCNGKGSYIPPGQSCTSCNGKGLVREKNTVLVDIPAGIDDGMRVRLAGQGDVPLEGQGSPGDLLIQVHVLLCFIIGIIYFIIRSPDTRNSREKVQTSY